MQLKWECKLLLQGGLHPPPITLSSSAMLCINRRGLLFLRYERRDPLAMKGITMEGVLAASKDMPIRVITCGWWKSCIFSISLIIPVKSLSVNRPGYNKGWLSLMERFAIWTHVHTSSHTHKHMNTNFTFQRLNGYHFRFSFISMQKVCFVNHSKFTSLSK